MQQDPKMTELTKLIHKRQEFQLNHPTPSVLHFISILDTLKVEYKREVILRPGRKKATLRPHRARFFLIDFYLCWPYDLYVEIDGGVHTNRLEYDLERDSRIMSTGKTVIRFTNDEIKTPNFISRLDKILSEMYKKNNRM